MLYAKLQAPGFEREVEWHVGEKLDGSKLQDLDERSFVCTFVQADGDELEYIVTHFINVPYSKLTAVQKWRGDMAAFIFDALPRKWS